MKNITLSASTIIAMLAFLKPSETEFFSSTEDNQPDELIEVLSKAVGNEVGKARIEFACTIPQAGKLSMMVESTADLFFKVLLHLGLAHNV